jgi:hypothetical protein
MNENTTKTQGVSPNTMINQSVSNTQSEKIHPTCMTGILNHSSRLVTNMPTKTEAIRRPHIQGLKHPFDEEIINHLQRLKNLGKKQKDEIARDMKRRPILRDFSRCDPESLGVGSHIDGKCERNA